MMNLDMKIDLQDLWDMAATLPTFVDYVRATVCMATECNTPPRTLYKFNGNASTGSWWPTMTKKNGTFPTGTLEMNAE